MEWEHGALWGAIRNAVELIQKRADEATVAALKMQVSKIDSFTQKNDTAVRSSISQIKDLTYVIQLHQWFEHLEELEN